jgi:hypothetical protein
MREQLQAILAGLLIIVVSYFGYRVLFRAEEDAQLIVSHVQGRVTLTDAAGAQEDALSGLALSPDDELAVGEDSTASLSIGGDSSLILDAQSSIRVVGIEASGIRVELDEGRVSAKVRPGSPSLSISSRGRAVTADDASFSVNADIDGALSISAEQGSLALSGFGEQATLDEGRLLSAVPGEAPVLGPIPDEILLEVHWPELAATREEELYVEGRTSPYAEILVTIREEKSRVRARADGSFRTPIYLVEGDNAVHVVVEDGVGNRSETSRDFERRTTPPVLNIEVQWQR